MKSHPNQERVAAYAHALDIVSVTTRTAAEAALMARVYAWLDNQDPSAVPPLLADLVNALIERTDRWRDLKALARGAA